MDNEVHIGKRINILAKRIHRTIDKEEAAQYGLTGVQARILGFVYHKSDKRDIFQRDIEEELGIRRSSVTDKALQLMEKNGYIQSKCFWRYRLKKIILTEKGLEIQENVYNFILKIEKS